jgi:hypothetical protein
VAGWKKGGREETKRRIPTFDFRWRHPRHAALVCRRFVVDAFAASDLVRGVNIGEPDVLVIISLGCVSARVDVSFSGSSSICAIFILVDCETL